VSRRSASRDSAPRRVSRPLELGFGAFELTPITYGGPEAFDKDRRERLRDLLAPFHLVTVHSSSMGSIGDADPAKREAAQERYRALVRLAIDLDADVVTAHPGQPEPSIFDVNVEMGKKMVSLAEESGLALGFELFDVKVAQAIGSGRFGALFDVGHASRRALEVDTDDVLAMIDEMESQIVQFHLHGVGAPDKMDHLPLAQNTWLDYERIMKRIAEMSFAGPLILEIGIRGNDGVENLKDCVVARDVLLRGMEKRST
jgi:sugar phosphate isomerase/epimerase